MISAQDGRVESVLVMEQFNILRKDWSAGSAVPTFFIIFSGDIDEQVSCHSCHASCHTSCH